MTDNNNASLIGEHAQYAKGAVEEVIGSVTGSQAWKGSGAQDKQEATEKMRASNQETNYNSLISGTAEKKVGSVVGCPGMVNKRKDKNEYFASYYQRLKTSYLFNRILFHIPINSWENVYNLLFIWFQAYCNT